MILGGAAVKANNTLTFDYYLDSQKILKKYLTRFTEPMFLEMAEKRRALLKESSEQADSYDSAFEKAVNEATHINDFCEQIAQSRFYDHLKVEKHVFMKSQQMYSMDPAKRATYEEQMATIVAAQRSKAPSEMTREQVLEAI